MVSSVRKWVNGGKKVIPTKFLTQLKQNERQRCITRKQARANAYKIICIECGIFKLNKHCHYKCRKRKMPYELFEKK